MSNDCCVPIIVPTLSEYTFDAGAKAGCPTKSAVLVDEDQQGFTKTVNRGLWKAFGDDPEYVVILNDDAYPSDRDWLLRMIDVLRDNPTVGIVGASGMCATLPQARGVPYMKPAVYTVHQLAFFCVVVRCAVFDDIGLLDEEFIHYGSDSDFVLRAAAMGWRSAWVQHVYIVHHKGDPALSTTTMEWKKHDTKVFRERYAGFVHRPVRKLRHTERPSRKLTKMVLNRIQ